MHYPGHEMHPDAKARSRMLAELARRWDQRLASDWGEPMSRPPVDEAEEPEESAR